MNLSVIVEGVLLVFPLVRLGRRILDRKPTKSRAARVTTFVHYSRGILLGVPLCRALVTRQDWPGWVLPVPTEIGFLLVIITGAASLLTVVEIRFGASYREYKSRTPMLFPKKPRE